MMNILMIPFDSKIPNLALMKLSTYHKQKGDHCYIAGPYPDKIYCSVIFKESATQVAGLQVMYPDVEMEIGGSGVDLNSNLPDGVDLLKPDYSLYPGLNYSMGFTTRGCIRDCYFCIVREKEGLLRRVQHPKEFWDPSHRDIILLDNNILADKKWFMEITDWILEEDLKADFNQGLDIRLLDLEIAHQLTYLKRHADKPWKFAFDSLDLKDQVKEGIDLLKKAGMNVHRNVMFYVYCHDESQVWDAHKRCELLRKWETLDWVMPNRSNRTPLVNALYRWSSRKQHRNLDFHDYLRRKGLEPKQDDNSGYTQACLYPSSDPVLSSEDEG